MKRKRATPPPEDSSNPVAPEILEGAKRLASHEGRAPGNGGERMKPASRCVVCNGEASQMSGEPLCWVCRRLKISAWKEAEQQAQAQE